MIARRHDDYEHLANQPGQRHPCAGCGCPRWAHLRIVRGGEVVGCGCACGKCERFKFSARKAQDREAMKK